MIFLALCVARREVLSHFSERSIVGDICMFAGVLQISVAGMSLKWLTSLILHQFCSHPNHHLAKGQSMLFLPFFTFSSCTVHRKNEERERERERERDVSSCFSLKHKLLGQLNSGAKFSVDAHLDYGQGL
jgi:hypothetical protein